MNRGSLVGLEERCEARLRFNEAPIHESGKSTTAAPKAAILTRFNEAPIHESGKLGSTCWRGRGHAASMRPRFMNRGSEAHRSRLQIARPASMRPRFMNRGSCRGSQGLKSSLGRFNEAPIHESGKSGTP